MGNKNSNDHRESRSTTIKIQSLNPDKYVNALY